MLDQPQTDLTVARTSPQSSKNGNNYEHKKGIK